MTPDANPLLGPMPGVRGFWVAAGLSLNGFGGGGRDRPSDRGLDHGRRPGRRHRAVPGVAVRRHVSRSDVRGGSGARDLQRLLPAALPVSMPMWPAGRAGSRRSTDASRRPAPSSGRRPAGSAPTCTSRAGRGAEPAATRRAYGWTRPPWFERVVAEGRAVRERAGHHRPELVRQDRRRRPGRARRCCSGSPRTTSTGRSGSIVYTPWCDERGGMVADVTITRLADRPLPGRDRAPASSPRTWRGCAGTASRRARRRDPRRQRGRRDDRAVGTRGARRSSAAATPEPVDDDALPMRQARTIRVGPAPVLAARISYAGELGWELTTDPAWAVDGLGSAARGGSSSLRTAWSRSAIARSTRSGWRRAIATTAST